MMGGGKKPTLKKLEVPEAYVPEAYKGITFQVYSKSELCYLKWIKIDE